MINEWRGRVSGKTVRLFNRWVEKVACQGYHSHSIPETGQKFIFVRKRVRGKLVFDIEILSGISPPSGGTPRPKEWTDVDEFGITFLDLSKKNQKIILGAEDPYKELEGRGKWREFIRSLGFRSQKDYESALRKAMVRLQHMLEKKDLVPVMRGERELHGWQEIADFLQRGILVTRMLATEYGLPVALLGKTPYSTEEKLRVWMEELVENHPIWKEELKKSME